MSTDYKDFGPYNTAAEQLRPTARIQLLQRILNSASLISSLGQGVPLKWAQSYKAFQVLKYVSGQDPVDVTSAKAITAVDSILHEAESQLKASQDDLDLLCTELDKMPLRGTIKIQEILPPLPEGKTAYVFLAFGNTTRGIWVSYAPYNEDLDSQPSIKAFLGSENSFPASYYRVSSDNSICKSINNITGSVVQRVCNITIPDVDNVGSLITLTVLTYANNSGNSNKAIVSAATVWGNDEGQIQIPMSDYQSDVQQIYDSGVSPMTTAQEGRLVVDPRTPFYGYAEVSEYLGLPDPTEVIEILDGLGS